MYRPNKYQAYQTGAIFTASPAQLVLMLFDGAIKFINIALEGFKLQDPLEFNLTIHQNIQKSQAIIRELRACLDRDKGPEFADRMSALYNYFDRRLQDGNLQKTQEPILEVLQHLEILKDSWKEMMQKQGAERSGATQPQEAVGNWSATG